MEPRWYEDGGERVFKVKMNEGEDPTLVFRIDFISRINCQQDRDGSMVANVEFYVSEFTQEAGDEWVDTPMKLQSLSVPELKRRKLMLMGESDDEKSVS